MEQEDKLQSAIKLLQHILKAVIIDIHVIDSFMLLELDSLGSWLYSMIPIQPTSVLRVLVDMLTKLLYMCSLETFVNGLPSL